MDGLRRLLCGGRGWARSLGAAHAKGFSPSRSADNNLIAQRSSAGALTVYAASETLAVPGRPQGTVLTIHYQFTTINYPLSTVHFQLSIIHLPRFTLLYFSS